MGYSLQDLGDGRYRVSGVRIHPLTGKYVTQKETQMTETVQVPVDLLKKLANSYHNYSDHDPYAVTSAMPSHVVGLVSLIPEPIKVGDKIKGAAFAALPPLSVAIDFEGDVWVRTAPGDAALISSDGIAPAYYSVQADDYMAVDFSEGTVVHIGEEVN